MGRACCVLHLSFGGDDGNHGGLRGGTSLGIDGADEETVGTGLFWRKRERPVHISLHVGSRGVEGSPGGSIVSGELHPGNG